MKKLTILLLFLFTIFTYAKQSDRLSMNLLSLMTLGDVNIAYENKFEKQTSWVITYHIGPSTDVFFDQSGTMMRLSYGYRFYRPISRDRHQFIETKLGALSDFENVGKLQTRNTYLLFELYVGEQVNFNSNVFYEYKIGLMRNLSTESQFNPGLGANLGIYL